MVTENIIDRYLTTRLGDYDRRGQQMRFDCPHCDDGHKKNLEINLGKNIFNCWSCGYSGPIRKIMKEYSVDDTWRNLDCFKVVFVQEEISEKIINYPQNVIPVHLSPDVFNYLINVRKLDKKEIRRRQISYVYDEGETYYNHICYPFYEDGKLVGACLQNFATMKYRNLSKLDFVPYKEFINDRYPITVTEGNCDAISSINAIPLLGTKVNKAISEYLIDKDVILAVDNSVDINHLTEIMQSLIHVKQMSIFNLGEYEDMNDYAVKNIDGFLTEYRKCYKEFE